VNPYSKPLSKAQNRDDLVTLFKVFREVERHIGGTDWDRVLEAFRERAKELGIVWKG
jgi:hypothetical protein